MQIAKVRFEILPIVLPRHPVHPVAAFGFNAQ